MHVAGLTVLVAEDHEDTRDFLAMALGDQGYHVLTAEDGLQAVELADAHSPAAIVMDLNMPIMDGLESARQIKCRPGLKQVPIIACSGYDPSSQPVPDVFAMVLVKPVSAVQLLSALRT